MDKGDKVRFYHQVRTTASTTEIKGERIVLFPVKTLIRYGKIIDLTDKYAMIKEDKTKQIWSVNKNQIKNLKTGSVTKQGR